MVSLGSKKLNTATITSEPRFKNRMLEFSVEFLLADIPFTAAGLLSKSDSAPIPSSSKEEEEEEEEEVERVVRLVDVSEVSFDSQDSSVPVGLQSSPESDRATPDGVSAALRRVRF
jgi:hypothetical protein